jgi:hypothetical protein
MRQSTSHSSRWTQGKQAINKIRRTNQQAVTPFKHHHTKHPSTVTKKRFPWYGRWKSWKLTIIWHLWFDIFLLNPSPKYPSLRLHPIAFVYTFAFRLYIVYYCLLYIQLCLLLLYISLSSLIMYIFVFSYYVYLCLFIVFYLHLSVFYSFIFYFIL